MTGESWLYVALLLLGGLHLLSLAVLAVRAGAWRGSRFGTGGPDADSGAVDRSDWDATRATAPVDCDECGAANERGYRFCRSCVAELPGTAAWDRTSGGNRARNVF